MNEQEQRRKAFAKLLKSFDCSPEDYDEGEEEDPRPYLSGEKEINRWVCVTINYSSHGAGKFFFLPTFSDRYDAQQRAVEYATDDIFEEMPERVIDLDTGEMHWPIWKSVQWS